MDGSPDDGFIGCAQRWMPGPGAGRYGARVPTFAELGFLLLALGGPLVLYRLIPSTRHLPRFTGPQRGGLLALDLIRVAGCLFLPYALTALLSTLWDTHFGWCAKVDLTAQCWDHLSMGLLTWGLAVGVTAPLLTGLIWVTRPLGQNADGQGKKRPLG